MSEKSFQLIRTDPALTSNVKVVVDSNYNLYLETYSVNQTLSDNIYKHFPISKFSKYEQMLVKFYKGIPINLAFDVHDNTDVNVVQSKYQYQFDDTYFAGAKEIEDQWYEEEFEYAAPLYVKPSALPQSFVILRVDDPAIFDPSTGYVINTLDKTNFRQEVIDKWKCVKFYDMSYQSDFGYWLYTNFTANSQFPKNSFQLDIEDNHSTVCTWNGIDFNTGVYASNYESTVNNFYWEQPHFRMEEYITNGFSRNGLIYPHILNLKFLYDDTPATPFQLNQYSINRYYGFYTDQLDYIMDFTSYNVPQLNSGLTISNNIFMSVGQITGSAQPFNWVNGTTYYIYAFGQLQEVRKSTTNGVDYYKIISNKNITISDVNNNGVVNIQFSNTGKTYKNSVVGKFGQNLIVDPYQDRNETWAGLYGDLYLININGQYHVLKSSLKSDFNLSGLTIYSATTSTINDTWADSNYLYFAQNTGLTIYSIGNSASTYFYSGITCYSVTSDPINKVTYAGTPYGILVLDVMGNVSYINSGNSTLPGNIINKVYYKNGYLMAGISGSTNYWWINYNGGISGSVSSLVTSLEVEGEIFYVGFDNTARKFYDWDPYSYIDYSYANSAVTFPNSAVTSIRSNDGVLLVSTLGGLWVKYGDTFKLYNPGYPINDMKISTEGTTAYLVTTTGLTLYNYATNTATYQSINGMAGGTHVSLITDNHILYSNINQYNYYNLPDTISLSDFEFYIQSDYAINSDSTTLEYWIESQTSQYDVKKSIYTGESGIKPVSYPIYRLKFTDIKDFDFDRVNTHFADFDYEKTTYVSTDEPKLHAIDYTDPAFPPDYKTMPVGSADQGKIMNVSSEYIADDELWEVYSTTVVPSYRVLWNLNNIWKKTQSICKWGFQDSISHSDYIYKLDNSLKVGFEYNRTANYDNAAANIFDKNLDYFYRIGDFYDGSGNFLRYKQQSTNIETSIMNPNSQRFNLDLYVGSSFDYYDYFFNNYMIYEDNDVPYIKGTKKYSNFNYLNHTVFKGVMISLQQINNIIYTNNEKPKIYYTDKSYEDYRCSVIFNPAYDFYNYDYTQPHRVAVTGVTFYNPLYLKAYDINSGAYLGVKGYDNGITLSSATYLLSSMIYRESEFVYLEQVKEFNTPDQALLDKDQGRLYFNLTGYTISGITLTGYSFISPDIDGVFVNFTGTSSDYYINSQTSGASLAILVDINLLVVTNYSQLITSFTEIGQNTLYSVTGNTIHLKLSGSTPGGLGTSVKSNYFEVKSGDVCSISINPIYTYVPRCNGHIEDSYGNTISTFTDNFLHFTPVETVTITQSSKKARLVILASDPLPSATLIEFTFQINMSGYTYQYPDDNAYVSLTNWDENDFTVNYQNWINNGILYERTEPYYTSGGIQNDNLTVDNSQNGVHVFLNDKYKNLLVILNQKISMMNEYGDINNVDVFGENYGLYYGTTLNGAPFFDQYPPFFKFDWSEIDHVVNTAYTWFNYTSDYGEVISGSNYSSYNNLTAQIGDKSYGGTGYYFNFYTNSQFIQSGRTLSINITATSNYGASASQTGICYIQIDTGFTGQYYNLTAVTVMNMFTYPIYTINFSKDFYISQAGDVRFLITDYFFQNGTTLTFNITASTFGIQSANIYDPSMITAYQFMNACNWFNSTTVFDQPITYHYIDANGNYSVYPMTVGTVPPYLIQVFTAKELNLKSTSFDVEPVQNQALFNAYRPSNIINEPIARIIEQDNTYAGIQPQGYGETPIYELTIYRHDGPYEPVFKNIDIFNKKDYTYLNGNLTIYEGWYRFGDNTPTYSGQTGYQNFGTMEEMMISKVNPNRSDSILKLSNTPENSIYPMVDEYGLDFEPRFIFKSNWDSQFFITTSNIYNKL